MKYKIELGFRTGNDQEIKKTKVRQRISATIEDFPCRSVELPDFVWIIELNEDNWSQALYKILSKANVGKSSTAISTFDDNRFQAFCTNTGIVGAESVWISVENTELCFRENEWAIAAIAQQHSEFRKTFRSLFGQDLLPVKNEDYILDLDLLMNAIGDYYTVQNEKQIKEYGHGFLSDFDVADSIFQDRFWEDTAFLSFWHNWRENQSEEYILSQWAYLLKCMIAFLLNKEA